MAGEAHFEIYPRRASRGVHPETGQPVVDRGPEFGWRFRAANGEISAIGGEGFTRREDANRAIHDFLREVYAQSDPHPPTIDVDD
jgi:uncharacterized protein YegP (UPF0339 family)